MPSGNGHVESAVAFEDAVRLHFQNVMGLSLLGDGSRKAMDAGFLDHGTAMQQSVSTLRRDSRCGAIANNAREASLNPDVPGIMC